MRLSLITAPTKEPITLAEAKLHLRQDNSDEDTLIESLIVAAREQVENVTRRALMPQTWDYSLSGWPCGDAFTLPFGTLASVTNIKWKDEDGTETTLTVTTDYLVETNGDACGRIVLPYGKTWPTGVLYPSNPITVRYVCGWTSASLVPAGIKAATLMILTDLYENRETQLVGTINSVYSQNTTAKRLLDSWILRDEF